MSEPSTTSPPPPTTKSWADQADEETNQTSTSAADETSSLNVNELTIDEENKSLSKSLDDPDDSNITAVRHLYPLFSLSISNLAQNFKIETEFHLGFMNFGAGYSWRHSLHIRDDLRRIISLAGAFEGIICGDEV